MAPHAAHSKVHTSDYVGVIETTIDVLENITEVLHFAPYIAVVAHTLGLIIKIREVRL
jgi:hypothetical protein